MAARAGTTAIEIKCPDLRTIAVRVVGTAPYVQNKFSAKAKAAMIATQEAGSTSKTRKLREAKDFDDCYESATHYAANGRCGIPAPAFRAAMIDACRLCGLVMTRAKLAIFVLADDVDVDDGTPLVYIDGDRERTDLAVRLETGVCDIRTRPMWTAWTATLRIRYDADMLTAEDLGNLLQRAGMQVGIGEGRPNSKSGFGCGWGTFSLA